MNGQCDKGWKSLFLSASCWGQDGGYLTQVGTNQKEMERACFGDKGQ